jgi:hypothetical protein
MKIILFNGPPRCGKDTASNFLGSRHGINNTIPMKFAAPLHAAAKSCLPESSLLYYSEEHKDEIIPALGVSYRQLCINLSEDHFKPTYGVDIFGRLAAASISSFEQEKQRHCVLNETTYIFSDSGFAYESQAVIDMAGPENVTLVRIYREGCSFSGDSRSYIDLSNQNISAVDILNGDITEFRYKVFSIYYAALSGNRISLG